MSEVPRALLASIGPTTSDAIRKHGHTPDMQAANATIASLLDAIIERAAAALV